jgi:hydroxyethylthiazole kinase-like uncharacterized protein yjeF
MSLRRIAHQPSPHAPLHDVAATRAWEARAQAKLPPHALMQRAGEAVYRLGAAIAPHARRVWVVCGGGNNGGDGLLAAVRWQQRLQPIGGEVAVTWLGSEDHLPPDARHALGVARGCGLRWTPEPPSQTDLAIDALFGIGLRRPPHGEALRWIAHLQERSGPVLCVDLPSGLDADRGEWLAPTPLQANPQRHTLALLTLKPGLFTGQGREAAGHLWFDDLDTSLPDAEAPPPAAWLHGQTVLAEAPRRWQHGAHKGRHGNLLIVGGQLPDARQPGMTGAAVLAARAGLHAGAGRVYVGLLPGPDTTGAAWPAFDPLQPELMLRSAAQLRDLAREPDSVSVCGCGGGQALAAVLPDWLPHSPRLVLDADALNAIAREPRWQQALARRAEAGLHTVLTPHPLEAARLLGTDTMQVQRDRLRAAQTLADTWRCVVVLKGSGSITAAPGLPPRINASGNGLLATAGTGDVLAGLIGARLCLAPTRSPIDPAALQALVADAVYAHGRVADTWPTNRLTLCAGDMPACLGQGGSSDHQQADLQQNDEHQH